MIRPSPLVLLLAVAACSPEPQRTAEVWSAGRDGLCLAGEGEALRAGLVAYGPGNTNCSLAGTASREGERLLITPRGEGACRVEVRLDGDTAVVGARSKSCEYYCGPGADYSGKRLQRSSAPVETVTDLAGERLC